jgi:hypothetical protein
MYLQMQPCQPQVVILSCLENTTAGSSDAILDQSFGNDGRRANLIRSLVVSRIPAAGMQYLSKPLYVEMAAGFDGGEFDIFKQPCAAYRPGQYA